MFLPSLLTLIISPFEAYVNSICRKKGEKLAFSHNGDIMSMLSGSLRIGQSARGFVPSCTLTFTLLWLSPFAGTYFLRVATLMVLGLSCSDLGMVSVSTPFSNVACALSVRTEAGNCTERWNAP